jgi:hypothetical protein
VACKATAIEAAYAWAAATKAADCGGAVRGDGVEDALLGEL